MYLNKANSAYIGYDKETKEQQAIVIKKQKDEYVLTFFSKEYIGRLFKNDKQGNEKRPDYTASIKDKLSISIWLNEKDGDKYFTSTIQQKGNDLIKEKVERDKKYDPIGQQLKDNFDAEETPF